MKQIKALAKVALAATAAMTMTAPAHAAIYTYDLEGGAGLGEFNVGWSHVTQPDTDGVLTIDTESGIGSVIGGALDVAFSGDFSSFTGGNEPHGMYDITITPDSTISFDGQQYTVNNWHQPMLELFGDNINLWAVWTAPNCDNCIVLGDTLKDISSSSGGDHEVPEPGMLGLFGIGAAAIMLRRRRKLVKAKAA